MKIKLLLIFVTGVTLLFSPKLNYAQAPNLHTAANFVLFTTVGAVGNTGTSRLTGNVGTNTGSITGFGNVNGGMHNTNAVTARAKIDLLYAYDQLNSTAHTFVHGPVLGNGETLIKGVYSLAAAASIVGNLILDAQGDSNAVFIIKTGGALTTAAYATVSLINGALACNVFWKVEGAASFATGTIMRGTIIANNGAIAIGAGCTLEGRALSTTGAVNVYETLAYIPLGCGSPELTGPNFPDLACAACFAIFSGTGAVTNSGVTHVTGNIGTHTGLLAGFNPLFVTGDIHQGPSPTTAQILADLLRTHQRLDTLPHDIELLYPAQFGNNLVLTPHTYLLDAATTLTGDVYLNAQGNANAIFVIKINSALSTSTYANIKLINGTQAKNVFWKVEGAVSINEYSIFRGNIIVNNAAIILNTGVTLYGRAFTTTGAISTLAITANIIPSECMCYVLPNKLLSFTAVCDKQRVVLTWSTATEINNKSFTVERSDEGINWQAIGTVAGAGNSSDMHTYSFTDNLSAATAITYYRLKQTDFNNNFKYSNTIIVKNCGGSTADNLSIFPNPSTGKFNLLLTEDPSKVSSTEVFNAQGVKIYQSNIFQSKIDLSNKPAGVYLVRVLLNSKIITSRIVVEK